MAVLSKYGTGLTIVRIDSVRSTGNGLFCSEIVILLL